MTVDGGRLATPRWRRGAARVCRKGVGLCPLGARKEGSQAASLSGIRSAEASDAPRADMKTRGDRSSELGSARTSSPARSSARLGSARLGSARLGSARLGSARLGSARLGGLSARLLIILFAASSHSSAFKNIALSLHDSRRGGRRVDPEPSPRHANAAVPPRPKRQCHRSRTKAAPPASRRRSRPGPSSQAGTRAPVPGRPARPARPSLSRTGPGSAHAPVPCASAQQPRCESSREEGARASRKRAAPPRRGRRPGSGCRGSQDVACPVFSPHRVCLAQEYQYIENLIQ